jgi:general secretion pathway protein H
VRCARQSGLTLIEVMVVTVIVALAMTGIALGAGAITRADLRSSASTLVAASRFAYSRAVTQGLTTRVVLDFKARTIQVQETTGRVVLQRDDETGSGLHRSDAPGMDPDAGADDVPPPQMIPTSGLTGAGGLLGAAGDQMSSGNMTASGGGLLGGLLGGASSGQITDPFLAAMAQGAAGDVTGGKAGYRGPKFQPAEATSGEPRELAGDTGFLKVYSPHEPRPREDGRAYIYFFPGGVAEHTIVQFTDGDEEEPHIFSVEIHPLSGRAEIHDFELEPPEDLDSLQEAEE